MLPAMRQLSLDRINSVSPYKVWATAQDNEYNFITRSGVLYGVSFMEEMKIADVQSYQFSFARLNAIHSQFDDAIHQTLMAIICEFFNANNDILIYICDTSDGKETSRSRLFIKRFDEYEEKSRFIIKTASTYIENQGFYTAMIVERTNKHLAAIIDDFDNTANLLCDK